MTSVASVLLLKGLQLLNIMVELIYKFARSKRSTCKQNLTSVIISTPELPHSPHTCTHTHGYVHTEKIKLL